MRRSRPRVPVVLVIVGEIVNGLAELYIAGGGAKAGSNRSGCRKHDGARMLTVGERTEVKRA